MDLKSIIPDIQNSNLCPIIEKYDDWEFVSNTFEIELAALKKKHGR